MQRVVSNVKKRIGFGFLLVGMKTLMKTLMETVNQGQWMKTLMKTADGDGGKDD